MADNSVLGLFTDPFQYVARQNEMQDQSARRFAEMTPMQQAQYGIYKGAGQLGGGLAGLMGVQDPALQQISNRNALARQFDLNTPQGLAQYGQALQQAGDMQGGLQAFRLSQELGLASAKTRKETMAIEQEEKLRSELVALGPNATQADVLRTVTKYGSPDKILASLEASNRASEANATRLQVAQSQQATQLQMAQIAADSKIEAARMAGATAQQIAQMKVDASKEIAQMKNDFNLQNLDFKRSLLANQPLKPGLQKEEDNDFKLIDNLKTQVSSLEPVISTLTIDPKTGKSPLELGPVNNRRYELANATGSSTPESRAFANLERAVQNATNLKTDAAKGVQTDKDVLRFANELIAAYGKNDTKTTLESLTNFVNAAKNAQVKTLEGIERRRASQGVGAFNQPKTNQSPSSDDDLVNKYLNPSK